MGSEQSTNNGNQQIPQRQGSFSASSIRQQVTIRRQQTIANPGGPSELSDNGEPPRPGSTSPGPSVCSDVDLPYISYTVNRPIGGKH